MSAVTLGTTQCVNYNCVSRKGRGEHVLLEFQRSVVIACGFREGRWYWFVDVQKFIDLEPQTTIFSTIYKWLFQLDDSKSSHRKLLFGVPGRQLKIPKRDVLPTMFQIPTSKTDVKLHVAGYHPTQLAQYNNQKNIANLELLVPSRFLLGWSGEPFTKTREVLMEAYVFWGICICICIYM